jgi:sugar lactone lactonase YvrE
MTTTQKSQAWLWILAAVAVLATQSANAQIFGRLDNTVLTVDPVSGAQTPLATVPTSFQSAALDASAGRLYLADSNTLYIVNVTTGTVATLALSQSLGSPYEMVFDRVSGLLFALVNNGSRIVSINPTTGNVSTVAITGVNSSQAGSLTVGSGGASLFFLNNRTDLYRVTLATSCGARCCRVCVRELVRNR